MTTGPASPYGRIMETIGDISGIVLAGGQSGRMGGGDKSLLPLGETPILAHVMSRFTPQVRHMVISANGDPSRFKSFDLPVVSDAIEGFHGPLAGAAAGLSSISGNDRGLTTPEAWAVTVPGDTPFIPNDLVARLAAGLGGCAMSVAISAAGLHPVVGLWPISMVEALSQSLARGERRASQWVKSQGAAEVYFEPSEVGGAKVDPFFNINTPEDLAYARGLMVPSSTEA